MVNQLLITVVVVGSVLVTGMLTFYGSLRDNAPVGFGAGLVFTGISLVLSSKYLGLDQSQEESLANSAKGMVIAGGIIAIGYTFSLIIGNKI